MLYTGIDLFTIAKVIEDSKASYKTEQPELLPIASIDLAGDGSFSNVYKDWQAINAYSIGIDQEIKIETKAIEPDILSSILNGEEKPYFIDHAGKPTNFYAIGFRISLNDGAYNYYSYLKGTITINAKSIETKQRTTAIAESINFKPLITNHVFSYNNKPCRKIEVNTKKHNVDVSGWLAIQWTPDNFLPVPAPIIEVAGTADNIEVTLLSVRNTDTIRYTLDGTTPTLESEEYTEPIKLAKATTVKAVECATCKHTSAVAVKDINILAKPTITGEMAEGETVVIISSLDEGVIYRYTTDGEEPTVASLIFGSLTLYKNTTVKAYAEKAGFVNSDIATEDIKVRLPKPILKLGTNIDICKITIENASDYERYGAVKVTFYQSGTKLITLPITSNITVSNNELITAVATIEGNENSFISDIGYPNVRAQAPIIQFITENEEIKAKIYSKTLGCKIYYTLDGTEPNETSTLYSEPFTYNGETIKARAYKEKLNQSDIAIAELDIIKYDDYIGYESNIIAY